MDKMTEKILRRGSSFLKNKFMGLASEKEKVEEPIRLTDAQLDEDMPARFLVPKDPLAPKVQVNFNWLTTKYDRNELVDQMVMHFENEGETILRDSEDAKIL